MSEREEARPELEVAHVLMLDVVGYSKLPIDLQQRLVKELQDIVSLNAEVIRAQAVNKLIKIPTGDGMALVFRGDPQTPPRCAMELSLALRANPRISLRMGLHSGPVYFVRDINDIENVAGDGINFAQRVMDCGDAGHILLSHEMANTLRKFSDWNTVLHDLGEVGVKHGVRVHLFNLYRTDVGNPQPPDKVRAAKQRAARLRFALVVASLGLLGGLLVWQFARNHPRPTAGNAFIPITGNPEETPVNAEAISPDGKYLAYIDRRGVFLHDMESQGVDSPLEVPNGPNFNFENIEWTAAWFPDSRHFVVSAYIRGKEGASLCVFSVSPGSKPSLECPRDDAWGAVVAPNDSSIAFTDGTRQRGVWVMGPHGEDPHRILKGDDGDSFEQLAWSPDGRRIAYIKQTTPKSGEASAVLENVDRTGSDKERVLKSADLMAGPVGYTAALSWTPDGRLIYALAEKSRRGRYSNLWELTVDGATGKPEGEANKITAESDSYFSDLSITTDGKRLAFLRSREDYDVYVAELDAGGRGLESWRPLIRERSNDWPTGWTSDSTAILFYSDRTGHLDIFQKEFSGGVAKPILQQGDFRTAPRASPEGSWFLFWAWPASEGADPKYVNLVRAPTSGGAPHKMLSESETSMFSCGRTSCVLSRQLDKFLVFWTLDPIHGTGAEIGKLAASFQTVYDWDISPDGLLIAFVSSEDRPPRIRVLDIKSKQVREVVLKDFTTLWEVAWAANGKYLYVTATRSNELQILSTDLEGSTRVLLLEPSEDIGWLVASPDGRHLAFARSKTTDSNVWALLF